jgi:signal transduction histidine kinase/ActR/RegA family two-component response regulator
MTRSDSATNGGTLQAAMRSLEHFFGPRALRLLLWLLLGFGLDAGAVVLDSALLSSGAGERVVQLPHRLSAADHDGGGATVRYRLQLELPPALAEPGRHPAVLIAAVSQSARMSVNGVPVGACAPGPLPESRCQHRPWLVSPPAELWRSGSNVIEVEVHTGTGPHIGLSTVEVDDAERLYGGNFYVLRWLRVRAVEALAWMGACLGVLALVAGRAIPKVRFLPALGLACLCNAAGNLLMVAEVPLLSPAIHDWVGFSARVFGFTFSALALLEFFANGGLARWRLGLGYAALASAAAALGADRPGILGLLYLPPLAAGLWMMTMLTRRAWTSGQVLHRAATAGAWLLVAAAVLDWLQVAGWRPYGQIFLWPYGWSAAMLVLATVVVHQFLHEVRGAQRIGSELAAVAESSASEALALRTMVDEQVQQRTRELEKLKNDAEADATRRAHFLAVMSHEIRNALTGLLGGLDMLGQAQAAAPGTHRREREVEALVGASARQLHALVDDLLDLSKFEAGQDLRVAHEAVDIRTLCTEALDAVTALGQKKSLELRFSGSHLPPFVQADRSKLRRVLDNLLSNAVKFTLRGHIELRAYAQPAEATGLWDLSLTVIDTGVGIDASLLPTLFQPYAQGGARASSAPATRGTGLGLYLARQLMRLQGGELAYRPGPAGGSLFEATLRVSTEARTAPDPCGEPAAGAIPAPAHHPLAGLRLLIVDDNEIVRKLMKLKLGRWGVQVVTAASATEALEHLGTRRFDAVLMDLSMPEVSGIELTRRIRLLQPASDTATPGREVPVVGLSAWALRIDAAECRAVGMDDWLPKPVPWPALVTTLLRLTGRAPRTEV